MRARGLVDLVVPRGGAGPDPTRGRAVDGAGGRDRGGQLPRLRARRRRPRHGARDRAQRQDPPAERLQRRRVAAGARRRSPTRSCPKVVAALHEHGVTVHGDEAFQQASPDVVPVTDEDHATEYLALEISAAVVARPRRRARAHPALLDRAHRGRRHGVARGRPPLHHRARRGRADGQRVDPVHRRRGARSSVPRSGSPRRSCTPADRWGWPS